MHDQHSIMACWRLAVGGGWGSNTAGRGRSHDRLPDGGSRNAEQIDSPAKQIPWCVVSAAPGFATIQMRRGGGADIDRFPTFPLSAWLLLPCRHRCRGAKTTIRPLSGSSDMPSGDDRGAAAAAWPWSHHTPLMTWVRSLLSCMAFCSNASFLQSSRFLHLWSSSRRWLLQ